MNGKQKSLHKFPRSSRLLKHADFQAVYKEGKRHFSGNTMAFYRARNEGGLPRVGFTVSKTLGGAVERNRIRRRLRSAVQRHLPQLAAPLDVVIHPRRQVLNMDFARLEAEIAQLFAAIQKGRTR